MIVDFKEYKDRHETKASQELEELNEEFNKLQEISEQKQRQFNLKYNNKKGNASLEDIDNLMYAMGSAGLAATALKEKQDEITDKGKTQIIKSVTDISHL